LASQLTRPGSGRCWHPRSLRSIVRQGLSALVDSSRSSCIWHIVLEHVVDAATTHSDIAGIDIGQVKVLSSRPPRVLASE
jgi:hypothetical protein